MQVGYANHFYRSAHKFEQICRHRLRRQNVGYSNFSQPQSHLRSEERFSRNAETDLVCRLLLEKKKKKKTEKQKVQETMCQIYVLSSFTSDYSIFSPYFFIFFFF